MKYSKAENGVFLYNITDFNLDHTFNCGQCFRWFKAENGGYTGVIQHLVINVCEKENGIYFDNCTLSDFETYLIPYFDFSRDYAIIKKQLSKDAIIRKAISFGYGIRILRQDLWEMIISFILSQRNSIPKIKKVIELLCKNFGNAIEYNGTLYYTFPSYEVLGRLSLSDLSCLKCGYRDRYILDAAQKVLYGQVDLESLKTMPYEQAKAKLLEIMGIGEKVAQCILLFGLQQFQAFPVDTWIAKVMSDRYQIKSSEIPDFTAAYFEDLSGFAQQYLFFCERENGFGA